VHRARLHARGYTQNTKPGEYAWDLIVPLGKRPNKDGQFVHRQQWVRFVGTRKQAEMKLNDLVGEAHHGQFIESSKVTLGDRLDQWLDNPCGRILTSALMAAGKASREAAHHSRDVRRHGGKCWCDACENKRQKTASGECRLLSGID
jgi:hypothetical protein